MRLGMQIKLERIFMFGFACVSQMDTGAVVFCCAAAVMHHVWHWPALSDAFDAADMSLAHWYLHSPIPKTFDPEYKSYSP